MENPDERQSSRDQAVGEGIALMVWDHRGVGLGIAGGAVKDVVIVGPVEAAVIHCNEILEIAYQSWRRIGWFWEAADA